jgi:hypothetical protein
MPAVNINFVAFSSYLETCGAGASFVLTVAAAEAAIGLAILVCFFQNQDDARRRQRHERLRPMETIILFARWSVPLSPALLENRQAQQWLTAGLLFLVYPELIILLTFGTLRP